MLYYDRIEVSEGIDVNKTYTIRYMLFVTTSIFLDKGFQFQLYVCNRCRDVLMMSLNLNVIVILNIQGVYYCCIINRIGRSEAMKLLQNAGLSKNLGHYRVKIFFITFKKWVKK